MKKAVLGIALAVSALLGGPGVAQAAPSGAYIVEAWHDVEIRDCEHLACNVTGMIKAGQKHIAYCWEFGQNVRDHGYSNNIWIMVSQADGGRYLVPAIYLKGDEFANIPVEDDCFG